eukprot:CAMPEP_0175664208 /NCGR_PEP_ID=MMETSP0097-20121207/16410_1 /TAXON_ID=311494 /ORGANISM="Alexandrium monilatum, Strain CCMP3105" /LENGTH=35 /DNA_ID= /DNA_START= /DNA_END= /DNA_ORIENTATION=
MYARTLRMHAQTAQALPRMWSQCLAWLPSERTPFS